MKKTDLNINKNYFTQKVKSFKSKRLIQNPKKLFRKKSGEKQVNYTSLYLNQTSPYYNNAFNKLYLKKENQNKEYQTDKTCSSLKANYKKLNLYKYKTNSSRPQSSSIRKLPFLNNNTNSSMNFNPTNYMTLEEEKMNQEKGQLNKMIRFLNKQLNELKKENEEKDILLNNEEKELNYLINKNNLTEEEKDLNSIIMNYQNDNCTIEESKTINNQSNSSYTLLLKIKREIKNFNSKILEESNKIKRLKHSIIFTKLKEINIENELLEEQIKKIASLLNNSLSVKETNAKKIQEIISFEYNISVQNQIIEELKDRKEVLNKEELILKNNIKNIETNIDLAKKQVLKNTKELDNLRQKNKNLLNDKLINSKIIINAEEPNQNLKTHYITKINRLKRDIHFFKSKMAHDEVIKAKLKEQRFNTLESIKQIKNIDLPSKLLSLGENIENRNENQKGQNNYEPTSSQNNALDAEKIENLKKIYAKEKEYEKKLENKYKEFLEKFKELLESYKEQNKNQDINIDINKNNSFDNNNDNLNEIEFGIDKNNPFYTEEEKNSPEINLKFNSTQYNQFTYILFKNFESKGIVLKESYSKIINPFIEFANDKEIKFVQYPSKEFDLIVEKFTKIILDAINNDNKYNHSLIKIFLSALLFNSGCDIQKMIEYFVILFSYTRDYETEEEKYLKNLKNLYTKELKDIHTAVINYIESEKDEKNDDNYFPLIKLKELIEENHINLKDKYVEFLFYYLKKFDDKDAKLDYLQFTKINDLLLSTEDTQGNKQDISMTEEENKKLNTEPTKEEKFDKILKSNNKDNNINNEANKKKEKENYNNEEVKTEESATEITIDEYLKQLNEALESIKNALKNKNISFYNFVEDKKKVMNYEGNDIEYISINDLNAKLKDIGVILSDLKLSCICSKYSLQNDLRLINIKSMEEDINPK